MTEVTSYEYNQKQAELDSYNKQAGEVQGVINSLDSQIERLDKAYKTVHADYLSYKEEAENIKNKVDEKMDFKGQNRRKLDSLMKDLKSGADYCKRDMLDEAQDDISNKLTEKLNERDKQEGFLGHIKSAIRSAGNWLNTHFFNN